MRPHAVTSNVIGHRTTILQIIPRLDTGGAELATIEITDAVVRAGGRAIVVTEGGRMAERITAAGGELVTLDAGTKNPLAIWRNAGRLAAIISREGVDLVHARSRAPAWSALRAARHTGKPFVTTYHGAYAEKDPFKRLYNSVMARGDIVIANSQWTADLIRARYRTPVERVAVIPRGVDLERFDAGRIAPERIGALRAHWGIAEGQRIILHAARLTAWKGQTLLVDALARLGQRSGACGAVVVMAGDAQGRTGYVDELRERARAAGVEARVRLVGHVDDIAAAYAAAHVTVVASIEPEAFGRAAAEALAVGCPVITTALGAPPEIVLAAPAVEAGRITGWLVAPEADAMAKAIEFALSLSPAARAGMGERAAADMRARFTLTTMKLQTLTVYDQLLGTSMAGAAKQETAT
jgi:glycosyltransferase involved in cell wall biosynthesis